MKWKRARQSRNVEDRRGQRGRRVAAGGGLGLGGIAIVVVISLLLGQNPM
ncbi:MAG: neutral zinc metallopeptidase, partial [Wenzhouxiangellaceae bacterium]